MNYSAISIILSISCFIVILLVGLLTSILRATKEITSPYSFSRFQLWLWTLIIIPIFSLKWGHSDVLEVTINETSLILLSISGALTLTSTVITHVHVKARQKVKADLPSKNFFFDILVDENGQFSIGRLQNFVFTLVFAVIYITYFFKKSDYVEFENYVFVLMGISSGTYLFGKALRM
jgi:hypothetical protein